MPRDILVSIINYKTAELTIGCVRSVLADIGRIDVEVVIVDNNSGDGSAERIEGWIAELPPGPSVRLIRSPTNCGFAGGHNIGIGAGDARYYLILNSDAVLRPGFLAAIKDAADRDSTAGMIAPRLEDDDGTPQISCFRFPGPISEFIRGANSGPITRMLKRWDVPLGTDPHLDAIDWASFACILLNAQMIDKIGPMDEGYFLYFEDAAYCLRARRAGWRIQYAPEAVAVHFRGGSGPVKTLVKERKRLPSYFYSSRTRFFYQAHGRLGLWSANLLWALGRTIVRARRLAGRQDYVRRPEEARDLWINALDPLGPRFGPED